MSVIMTDMKAKPEVKRSKAPSRARKPVRDIFTVRDLNRQPQVVLTAAKILGRVLVRSRSGEGFSVEPVPKAGSDPTTRMDFLERIEDLHRRLKESGNDGFTTEGWDKFSKAIAGE